MKRRILVIAGVALCLSLLAVYSGHTAAADARFEVSYPVGLDNGPITGRVFVVSIRVIERDEVEAPGERRREDPDATAQAKRRYYEQLKRE